MPRFPLREEDILALAGKIVAGPTGNATVFPTPSVSVAALRAPLQALAVARAPRRAQG